MQEAQERRCDRFWRLLLRPVADVLNDGGEAQVGTIGPWMSIEIQARDEKPYDVFAPRNQAARLMDGLDPHLRQVDKVSGLVAVAVQRATKATHRKIVDVIIKIVRGQPRRKRVRVHQ